MGAAAAGTPVNLEVDIVAKYVEKLVGARACMSTAREDVQFATIEEALEDIAAGRMVVVVDDEDRENEGDLVDGGRVRHARRDQLHDHARRGGWICLALTPERCDELGLELMAAKNESAYETPFTVTIEAREGVTTGISVARPARTRSQVAVDPAKGQDDIVTPRPRPPAEGEAPAACSSAPATPRRRVDLARLAGLQPGRRDLRDP